MKQIQNTGRNGAQFGLRRKSLSGVKKIDVERRLQKYLKCDGSRIIDDMRKYLHKANVLTHMQTISEALEKDGHSISSDIVTGSGFLPYIFGVVALRAPKRQEFVEAYSYEIRFGCTWDRPGLITVTIVKRYKEDGEMHPSFGEVVRCKSWDDVREMQAMYNAVAPRLGKTYDGHDILFCVELQKPQIGRRLIREATLKVVEYMRRSEEFDSTGEVTIVV